MQRIEGPVRLGVIGCGNFARRLHLPNIVRIPEARLRAVCDIRAEVVAEVRAQFGAEQGLTDYRQLLADPAIDAVVVAVRDDLQAQVSIAAMDAGKHVYVEKPLAETPDACAAVVEAQRRTGRRLAVGFNRRFAPIYRRLREVMAADGGPRNVLIRMADDAWRWAKGYPPGYLIHLDVCHHFDLLRWFTGADIESVYCISSRPDDDIISVRMSNGTVASIVQSGHGTMDMPKERIEAICERGGAHAEDFVELRTYGYLGQPHVETFAGHSDPHLEFTHKYLYKQLGADALHGLRRVTWELRQRVERGLGADEPDFAEAKRYVERTIPNFMRDQGWLASLRAFVVGIATGEPTGHAGAEDALCAARAGKAAIQSRDQGNVVRLADVAAKAVRA